MRSFAHFTEVLARIEALPGGMDAFSRGWEYFGLTRVCVDGTNGIMYREWAPAARAASLVGDFNAWDAAAHPCAKDANVRERRAHALPPAPPPPPSFSSPSPTRALHAHFP